MTSFAPYAERRSRLLNTMQALGGGVAVIPTAPEVMRNRDADYPYRHDSSFYYLSGFTEPEAYVVLIATKEKTASVLFCRPKDPEREVWVGHRFGPEAAKTAFGFDEAYSVADIDQEMPRLLSNAPAIFYSIGHRQDQDARVQGWLNKVRSFNRSGVMAPQAIIDINTYIDDMRLFKDAHEISIMKKAGVISAEAHCRAMRFCRPGQYEYQLEAEFLHEFRRHGSQFPAYGSIVAAGANACIMHYPAGNAELKDGDLVLIDAGCELDSYASDITRTFPVNGKFSGPQRELYDIVLAAHDATIEQLVPGRPYIDGHQAAVKILAQGMLDTGLLDKNKVGTLDDVIANATYRQFYIHSTSHWLGMDVHDVGEYKEAPDAEGNRASRLLQPGMVLTIEPGIYVRPGEGVPEKYWDIGIRIEDDAHITPTGCEILTTGVPNKADEIEALMKQ